MGADSVTVFDNLGKALVCVQFQLLIVSKILSIFLKNRQIGLKINQCTPRATHDNGCEFCKDPISSF